MLRCACGGMNGHHTLDCRAVEMEEAARKHAIDREKEFWQRLKKIVREALEEHERDLRRARDGT